MTITSSDNDPGPLPASMRAVVMRAFGDPGVLRAEDVPAPRPGPGEAVVRVGAVEVSRTRDVAACSGRHPYSRQITLPHVLGGACAGVVAAVGEGVDPALAGRPVGVKTLRQPRMIQDPVSVAARAGSAPARSRPPARRHPVLALLGPAFVAAVAYVDPGNFATNITAGARYGYLLCWAVFTANLVAMLVQYLSAKLGLATGRDLPELCREHLPRPVSAGLWIQAELVAMATDLAEFVGAAIGLNLLFGVPLPAAGVLTALVAFAVLALEQRGHRRFELAIAALFGVVLLGFAYDLTAIGAAPAGIAAGLVPRFAGGPSVVLAVGIVGATVMPHVVYLHSALTARQARDTSDIPPSGRLRSLRLDVVLALGAASLVNLAMLAMAATLLHHTGITGADPILLAHTDLGRIIGGGAALVFAVALLASGLSSSSVGTYAGQVVMRGFLRRSLPLFARRAITMLPALAVLALRLPPTGSLVISQVVLSFGIPFALIPLVWLTRRTDVMGALANRPVTTLTASGCTLLITAMNVALVAATL